MLSPRRCLRSPHADKQDFLETTDVRVRLENIYQHLELALVAPQVRNKLLSEAATKKELTTAYVTYNYNSDSGNEINEILVIENVKGVAQAQKVWKVWLKTSHPSRSLAEVENITFHLYDVLKGHYERVFEIDAQAKDAGAAG